MSKPLGDDPLLRAVPEIDGYKVLGPCVLYGRVGAGGMGAVYRGRHMNLDLDVAVKCLKPSLMEENAEFVIRFRNEARFAATLNDPRLVRVFDVDEQHGLHYLVMEYVRGETLNERVRRKGALSAKEAARILLDAARGLASAHRAGVIHRDIKPDNILISIRGDVKVADLGLAKAMDGGSGLTRTRTVMGTPQYMAPEQWESTRDLGPPADVWALGCLLYFMLAGHPPIASGEFVEVMRRVCFEPFPDLPASLTAVPESLRAALQRCTAKDPADRFPNAVALAAALAGDAEETRSLADDGAGSGSLRCATVSPPPGETLARIRLQIKADRTPTPSGPAAVAEPGARPNDTAAPSPQRRRATSALVAALMPEAFRGDTQIARTRRRVAVWFLIAALLATAGIGYSKGWFEGGTKGDPRLVVLTVVHPASGFRTREPAVVAMLMADREDVEVAGPRGSKILAQDSTGTKIRLALVQEGESTFTFLARDAAGNVGTASLTVVRDTTGPVLTIERLGYGDGVIAGHLFFCGVSATDPSGVAAVTVNGAAGYLVNREDWSFTVTAPAAAGSWALEFVATDALGNRREEARTVDVRSAKSPAPPWYEVEIEDPDPAVVTDATFRQKLADLKLPWQVNDKKTGIRMRLVAPGTYLRGSPDSEAERFSDEGPQHHVTLTKPFYAGIYEVTQGEWQQVMGSNPSHFSGDPRLPVELSWTDFAVSPDSYCRKTGLRLLTEAEWEYLCRAGTTTPFSFGATISAHQANYNGNYTYGNGQKGTYREKTTAVGSFPANAWGFHDLHGNVWEWCADSFDALEYKRCQNGVSDPQGPTRASSCVLRGGSWYYAPWHCRAAYRGGGTSTNSVGVGIRVARAPYP